MERGGRRARRRAGDGPGKRQAWLRGAEGGTTRSVTGACTDALAERTASAVAVRTGFVVGGMGAALALRARLRSSWPAGSHHHVAGQARVPRRRLRDALARGLRRRLPDRWPSVPRLLHPRDVGLAVAGRPGRTNIEAWVCPRCSNLFAQGGRPSGESGPRCRKICSRGQSPLPLRGSGFITWWAILGMIDQTPPRGGPPLTPRARTLLRPQENPAA